MTIEPAAGIACEQFEKVDSASDGVGDCRRVAAFTASGRIEQAFEGVRDGSDTSKFNGLADIRGSPGAKSNGGIHAPEIVQARLNLEETQISSPEFRIPNRKSQQN